MIFVSAHPMILEVLKYGHPMLRQKGVRVEAITPATASSFSMLPTNSTSGTFTKVVRIVPVRISVHLGNRPTLFGTSAEVKIRVAD